MSLKSSDVWVRLSGLLTVTIFSAAADMADMDVARVGWSACSGRGDEETKARNTKRGGRLALIFLLVAKPRGTFSLYHTQPPNMLRLPRPFPNNGSSGMRPYIHASIHGR